MIPFGNCVKSNYLASNLFFQAYFLKVVELSLDHFLPDLFLEKGEGSVRITLVSICILDQPCWLSLPLGKNAVILIGFKRIQKLSFIALTTSFPDVMRLFAFSLANWSRGSLFISSSTLVALQSIANDAEYGASLL